jgi:hypothetical protein
VAEIAIGLVRCLCARETGKKVNSWLFELARLLVRLDHVASSIIKTMSGQRAAVLIFSSLPASPKTF